MELRAEIAHLPDDFLTYVTSMASKDSNWKFWKDFVLYHAFSYICLFLSTRGGVWKLRLAGIKCMAPLFAAFDRTHYQKIIPQHLSELLLMPKEVIDFFECGGFVCSVSGRYMHSVALDEAHEMLVNKDLKTTVVRPSKEYLDRILYYYPSRSNSIKKLKKDLLLGIEMSEGQKVCITDSSPAARRTEENIFVMRQKLEKTAVLVPNDTDRGLQSLSGAVATAEQAKDLLQFYKVGMRHFETRIRYYILREPSADVPQRVNTGPAEPVGSVGSRPDQKSATMYNNNNNYSG